MKTANGGPTPAKFGNFETNSATGAQRLCDMIKQHWAKQGKVVTAWPVLIPKLEKERNGLAHHWGIKSDIKITRFTAELPTAVQRMTPIFQTHYMSKPKRDAA